MAQIKSHTKAPQSPCFSVRKYKKSDHSQIIKLNDQCFSPSDGDYWQPEALTNFPDGPGANVYVLEQELAEKRVIAGFVFCRVILDEAELLIMGLGALFRGKRLSGQLLSFMINDLSSQAIKTIFLEVKESNNPAINLYKSMGFRQIGERPNYYKVRNEKDENALIFSLKII